MPGVVVAQDGEKLLKAPARAYERIERFGEDGSHRLRKLAQRIKQSTTVLKQALMKSASAVAEVDQATQLQARRFS